MKTNVKEGGTLKQMKITINDVDCVRKSMPEFFEYLIQGCKDNSIILN